MRICMLLGGTYPPDVRVRKEADALLAAGHEVTLLCRGGGDEAAHETVAGMGVIRFGRRTRAERASWFASGFCNLATGVYPQWARALDRAVRAGVDVVHVHDLPLVRTALVTTVGRDVPVVADLHENYPEAVRQYRRRWEGGSPTTRLRRALERTTMSVSRWKRLERDCTARADRVLTVCEEGTAHYVRDCGASADRITEISNTVDLGRFDAHLPDRSATVDRHGDDADGRRGDGSGTDERGDADGGSDRGGASGRAGMDRVRDFSPDVPEGFVISYVGHLGAHRGIETVVDALARAEDESDDRAPCRLLVVGPDDSTNADALRARARKRGVGDALFFTGWVDFERVPAYMAASDVCVVPHAATPHTETTIPHKLFQYMAASRPVVVTDVSPLKRIVEECNAGIVTPAGDARAMASALSELRTDPDRANALGRNGRRAVEERYHWERDAERLRDVYRALST